MSSKTTKTETKKPVDETRAIMKKAIAEKQKAIRDTSLYQRMKQAIIDDITEAAKVGCDRIVLPTVDVPGELGMPDTCLGNIIARCEEAETIINMFVDEFKAMGYSVFGFDGVPLGLCWAETDEK